MSANNYQTYCSVDKIKTILKNVSSFVTIDILTLITKQLPNVLLSERYKIVFFDVLNTLRGEIVFHYNRVVHGSRVILIKLYICVIFVIKTNPKLLTIEKILKLLGYNQIMHTAH